MRVIKMKFKKPLLHLSKYDILTCVSLFLFTIVELDARTSTPVLRNYSTIFFMGILALVAFEMLLKKTINSKQLLVFMVLTFLLVIDSIPSGFHMLIYVFFLIWGTRYCNVERCLKFLMLLIAVCTLLIVLLSRIGVYQDIVTVQSFKGVLRYRHSLGFSSWTMLSFQYLAIVSYYIYVKKGYVSAITYAILGVIGYEIYLFTDTKSAFYYLIGLMIICWILKFVNIKKWNRLYICTLMPWIMAGLSIIFVKLYRTGNVFFVDLNAALNWRLSLASTAIDKYTIHFLSFDARNIVDTSTYLVVDNSYLYCLLNYGVLGLLLILLLYSCIIVIAVNKQNKYLLAIIMVMLFVNMMWQRLLSIPDFAFLIIAGEFFNNRKKLISE